MTQEREKKGESMKLVDIQKLIDMLSKSELSELDLEMGDMRIKLSRHGYQPAAAPAPQPVPMPMQMMPQYALPPQAASAPPPQAAAPAPAAPPAAAPTEEAPAPKQKAENAKELPSPMVGTFYRAPAPGADSFVQIGDTVKKGQVLCIIEAMKLMNEIEAEESGIIVDILVENAQPVEFGEVLFHYVPAS